MIILFIFHCSILLSIILSFSEIHACQYLFELMLNNVKNKLAPLLRTSRESCYYSEIIACQYLFEFCFSRHYHWLHHIEVLAAPRFQFPFLFTSVRSLTSITHLLSIFYIHLLPFPLSPFYTFPLSPYILENFVSFHFYQWNDYKVESALSSYLKKNVKYRETQTRDSIRDDESSKPRMSWPLMHLSC